MIVRATGALLLSVRRKRRAAGTLTFSTVCTQGGAYRVVKGTSLLLVVGRSETSSCVAATEQAPSSVPASKGWLLCRPEQPPASIVTVVVIIIGSVTESSKSARGSCGSSTAAEKATSACGGCGAKCWPSLTERSRIIRTTSKASCTCSKKI